MKRKGELCEKESQHVRIGEVVRSGSLVPVHTHVAVPLIVGHPGCEWAVNWDALVVHSQAVSVGVRVTEQSPWINNRITYMTV